MELAMAEPNEWNNASNPVGLQAKTIGGALTLSERLAYSTARLECWDTNGGEGMGTAFFFDFVVRDKDIVPVLVTNKHVVKGARSARLRLHGVDVANNFSVVDGSWVSLQNFEDQCIYHPDPEVDLCVFPIAPIITGAARAGQRPAIARISANAVATDADTAKMDMIEEIVMIGYPNGIWDDHNGLPIMRRGTTATHVARNFHGRREFVIDMSIIPGSSGSPVFSYRGLNGASVLSDSKLLGIAYATFTYGVQGEVVTAPIPAVTQDVVEMHVPIGLGPVIKATRLLEFTDELERRSRPA
jgi:Trypsin-like peptidase domain